MSDYTPAILGITYNTPKGIWGVSEDAVLDAYENPVYCQRIIDLYKNHSVKFVKNLPDGATLREIRLFGNFKADRRIYWFENEGEK
jgi:hypothetical protein